MQEMLDHLYENYDIIAAANIEDKNSRMREPNFPTFSIETLCHQIKIMVKYTLSGKWSYQTAQVASRAYLLVL